jgi:hypothetical protein
MSTAAPTGTLPDLACVARDEHTIVAEACRMVFDGPRLLGIDEYRRLDDGSVTVHRARLGQYHLELVEHPPADLDWTNA